MKIGCISSCKSQKALKLKQDFSKIYDQKIIFIEQISQIKYHFSKDDVLIVLGGDGFMLRIIHHILKYNIHVRIYGINCGNLGFLLNEHDKLQQIDLLERVYHAIEIKLNPLKIELINKENHIQHIFAINEISLLRQTYQSIHINVFVNGILRISNLSGDGVLLASAAGSAAYNASSGGVILPINSKMISLTAINPFRPKGWKSAILNEKSEIEFVTIDSKQRPALACADFQQFYFVDRIKTSINQDSQYILLFDNLSHLEEKIMKEQFSFCNNF